MDRPLRTLPPIHSVDAEVGGVRLRPESWGTSAHVENVAGRDWQTIMQGCRIWWRLVVVCVLWLPAVAFAQQTTPAPAPPSEFEAVPPPQNVGEIPESMSLEDLLATAEAYNPTLVQAAAVIDIELGTQTQVGLYPNPILYYNGAQITRKGNVQQEGGYVEQTIMTAGKLKLNRAIAAQTVNQATWLQQQQVFRVTNAVRMRYYEILGAQRQVELTEKLKGIAENAATIADKLLASGEGTKPDKLQAEIEVGQAQILLNNARNIYLTSWKQMAATMGTPLMQPVPLDGSLDAPPMEFEWDSTIDWLTANSPEVMVAQAGVARSQIAIRRAQVEPWPNPNVQGWVQRDYGIKQNIVQVQVGIPTPIFNRNQGGIYSAMAEYRRSLAMAEQVDLSLRDRLSVAYRNYRNARQQVENYRTAILPKARESLELIREGYRRGELPFLQVLFAQRTYFQSNLAYVESLTNLWKSSVAISGMLLTETSAADTSSVPNAMIPDAP
ncbi:MAG: TolC family protein [Planctomycetales bacterium]